MQENLTFLISPSSKDSFNMNFRKGSMKNLRANLLTPTNFTSNNSGSKLSMSATA